MKPGKQLKDKPIGEFVAEDQRTAKVFNAYDIDFYCHGDDLLSEVCEAKSLNINHVFKDLETITSAPYKGVNYKHIPLDELADSIQNIHHSYIEAQLPILSNHLDTLCESHGEVHEVFICYGLYSTILPEN